MVAFDQTHVLRVYFVDLLQKALDVALFAFSECPLRKAVLFFSFLRVLLKFKFSFQCLYTEIKKAGLKTYLASCSRSWCLWLVMRIRGSESRLVLQG